MIYLVSESNLAGHPERVWVGRAIFNLTGKYSNRAKGRRERAHVADVGIDARYVEDRGEIQYLMPYRRDWEDESREPVVVAQDRNTVDRSSSNALETFQMLAVPFKPGQEA